MVSKLDLCLEIDPSKFLLVIGPDFTTSVIKELSEAYELSIHGSNRPDFQQNGSINSPRTPAFALKHVVDEGIRVLLDAEEYASDTERAKCELLYRNAYELDPQFAVKKVATSLQQTGRYAEWLKRAFEVKLESHFLASHSVSLHRIIELQSKGALLIYVHCDDILSRVSRTTPVLLEDPEGMEQWLKGEKAGFLHVHGVYWEPDTVKLDGQFYESPSHFIRPAAERLKELFQQKHTVVIGCESHPTDPLVSQFIKEYVYKPDELRHQNQQHTFHLPLTRASSKLDSGLPVVTTSSFEVESGRNYHRPVHTILCPITDSSTSLWRQIEFPSYELKNNQMLGLLVPGKQGAIEISKMMYNTPGVNFALVSSAMYKGHFLSVVCIRVDSSKIRDLWVWLFEEAKEILLGKGLLAIVMQSGTIVWVRGKPSSGANITAVNEFAKVLSEASHSAEDMMSEEMDTDSSVPIPAHTHSHKPNPTPRRSKSSTVVPQIKEEFSTSPPVKVGSKKIPRYTVTKFRVKQGGNVMINGLPSILKPSAKHPHISIDDSSLLAPPGFPKNIYGRRCSLPHNMKPALAFTDDQRAEARLNQLAEHMHSTPPHLEPPSYAAIKQALLCDQYKRRQSMQTDPKTLKNLLQTKLVISDKNDIVSLRRKSDPGSYLKQRDFERRKELFMDENRSWSQAYGKVIERKIVKWERKRMERMHREMLMRQIGGGDHGQFKFLFNPLTGQQGLINSLSATTNGIQPGAATSTLLAPSYLAAAAASQNAAAAGIGANPFIFSQPVIAPSTTAAAGAATITGGSSSMFYSPFLTPYTFVNPYAPTLQVTNALGQPTAATYFIPQQQSSSQKVVYFVPSTNAAGAATVSAAPATVPVAPANLPPQPTSILATSLSSNQSPSSTSSLTISPSPSIITQPPPPHHTISTSTSRDNVPHLVTSSSLNAPPTSSTPSSQQQQQQAPGSVSLVNFPQLSSLMAPISRTGHRNSLHSISSSSSSLSKDMSDEIDSYEYRPISPGSRKRHQSVPEKLTSLLQQHSPLRGHLSPVSHDEYDEDEPVTPPSVKKQRSTSDTTVLYPPYSSRFSQLSPPNIGGGGLGGHHLLNKSKSTSPQPQEQRQNLTALQSHLLKVHQVQQNSTSGGTVERQRRVGVHSPNPLSSSPGGTHNYSNYIIRENSPQEINEREMEDIVGGAIRSSGQQDHQGPAPHSQLQLWQFLLELLLISANTHLIQWTEGEFEFQIKSPTEVAQLWGQVTNNPSMNYEKLATGLRYYFTKGIMSKVPGKRLTFRYAGSIRNYVQMRRSQMISSHEEIVVVE